MVQKLTSITFDLVKSRYRFIPFSSSWLTSSNFSRYKMCGGYHVNLLFVVFVLLHVVCNDNFTSNYSAQRRGREGRRSWRKSSRKKLNIQSVPKLDWEATFIIAAAVSIGGMVVWYTLHEGAGLWSLNRAWVRIRPCGIGGCRFGVVTNLVTCMLLRIQLKLNYWHSCLKNARSIFKSEVCPANPSCSWTRKLKKNWEKSRATVIQKIVSYSLM